MASISHRAEVTVILMVMGLDTRIILPPVPHSGFHPVPYTVATLCCFYEEKRERIMKEGLKMRSTFSKVTVGKSAFPFPVRQIQSSILGLKISYPA
jgi:hypothetical protein